LKLTMVPALVKLRESSAVRTQSTPFSRVGTLVQTCARSPSARSPGPRSACRVVRALLPSAAVRLDTVMSRPMSSTCCMYATRSAFCAALSEVPTWRGSFSTSASVAFEPSCR
jgi:hypothetical protein